MSGSFSMWDCIIFTFVDEHCGHQLTGADHEAEQSLQIIMRLGLILHNGIRIFGRCQGLSTDKIRRVEDAESDLIQPLVGAAELVGGASDAARIGEGSGNYYLAPGQDILNRHSLAKTTNPTWNVTSIS